MTMKTTTATFALLAGTAAAFTPPEYAPSAPSFVTRTDNSSLSDATGAWDDCREVARKIPRDAR